MSNWKLTIMKHKRAKGVEFIDKFGILRHARRTGWDCGCQRQCMESVDPEYILTKFNEIGNHGAQNVYLRAHATRTEVKRRRPRKADSKPRSCSWKFKVGLQ